MTHGLGPHGAPTVHRVRIQTIKTLILQDRDPTGVVAVVAQVVPLLVGAPYLDEELQKEKIQNFQVRLVWDRSRHMAVVPRQTDSVAPEACPPGPMPVVLRCLQLDRYCATDHADRQLI